MTASEGWGRLVGGGIEQREKKTQERQQQCGDC